MSDKSESRSLSSSSITHVIFDFDGTLVNTMDIYLDEFRLIAQKYGKQFNKQFESFMINIESWNKLVNDFIKLHEIDSECDVQHLETLIKTRVVNSTRLELMPGVDKLVKHLHSHHIPMAIATGSSKQQFNQIIKHFDNYFEPKNYFNHYVCGNDEEVIQSKPNPQIYWLCAKRFDDPKPNHIKNVLVFEDSVTGISGAIASGMQTVWVKDRRIECNEDINCSLVINSLSEFNPQMFGLPQYQ